MRFLAVNFFKGSECFGRPDGVEVPFVEAPDSLPFSFSAFSSSAFRSSSFRRSASLSSELYRYESY
jgi:hypothetical protein